MMQTLPGTHSESAACSQGGDPYVAIRVRARAEITVAATLSARGLDTICPVYMLRRRWADRIKSAPSALFPCYIFSRFNPGLRRIIVTVPGVQDIVNNGRAPLPIEPKDVDVLKRLTLDNLGSTPYPLPAIGQRVRIECGPLAGVEGVLVRVKNQSRIVLSVRLLERSVITEVAEDHVTVI